MEAARDTRGGIPADPDLAEVPGAGGAPDDGKAVTKEVTGKGQAGKASGKGKEQPAPYAYVALSDLYLGGDGESGTMPVCAYRAGALVPPHDVDRFGWADQVRRADQPAPADEE